MDFALNLEQAEKTFITALMRQERWAQQQLYEEYYGKMMGVCLRYASSREEALNLLHDGFLKVFLNIGRYQPGTSLPAWIKTVVINICIDHHRKIMRRRTENIADIHYLANDEPDVLSRLSEQEILEGVQQLSPAYRSVFNLYVVEGYSHREIAEVLNITESTSRSNLLKSRIKLKEYFAARRIEFELRDDKTGDH